MKKQFVWSLMVACLMVFVVGCGTMRGTGNIGDAPPWMLQIAADAQQVRLDAIAINIPALARDIPILIADVRAHENEPELAPLKLAAHRLEADFKADQHNWIVIGRDALDIAVEINALIAPYVKKGSV